MMRASSSIAAKLYADTSCHSWSASAAREESLYASVMATYSNSAFKTSAIIGRKMQIKNVTKSWKLTYSTSEECIIAKFQRC